MRWVPLTDMVEHNNSPRQFFNEDGEIFIYGLKRVGGPSDTDMPRRVVGMGSTRGAAYASAVRAVRAYDSSYQGLPRL